MDYLTIKAVHMAAAALSYGLFLVRGVWMLLDSPQWRRRWTRVLPHVNDSVLLAAGIALAVMAGWRPGRDAWLTAKIVGLVVYIGLGMVALRFGRTRALRMAAWIAAQLVFAYIAAVAVTKNPWPLAALFH